MLGKTSESEMSDRLYDLIYELNQISPNVLLSVLPQLEFKLKVSRDFFRVYRGPKFGPIPNAKKEMFFPK
jgi:hypothetical protein